MMDALASELMLDDNGIEEMKRKNREHLDNKRKHKKDIDQQTVF